MRRGAAPLEAAVWGVHLHSSAGDLLAEKVGPLTKGAFWEIVAVPDIRGQAAGVARSIAAPWG